MHCLLASPCAGHSWSQEPEWGALGNPLTKGLVGWRSVSRFGVEAAIGAICSKRGQVFTQRVRGNQPCPRLAKMEASGWG